MAVDSVSTGTTATTGQSANALKTLTGDFQTFLKLLTVQLQNQDPTNPLDTDKMMQQIASLSQVEQQISTNKNLEQLISIVNATQYNSIVSYIGKQVEALGSAGSLSNGHAPFVYYLQSEASTVSVSIKDQAGNVVYTGAGSTSRGRNQFDWDGVGTNGSVMPNGVYSIEVQAKDSGGNDITLQTYTTGIVNAIDSAGGNVYLSIGDPRDGLSIPVDKVTTIRESTINS
jgi:flagellar basal-body rod modification protein FlgD